jgi:UDP-glucuronate decarboxylase
VSDLIDGFVKMMDQEMDLVGPINLGNPIEMTMLELAEIVLQKTKSSSKLDFRPLPEDDPRQRQPDISKASNLLNWAPSLDLADGLDLTVDYFANINLQDTLHK